MNLGMLEKFAREARRLLNTSVADKIARVTLEQSPERRDNRRAVEKLEREIKARGLEAVVEEAAYTWFNRFCAFRFMDANRYTGIMVVSPLEGATQPQLLADARNGVFDESIDLEDDVKMNATDILLGKKPSSEPFAEAYRVLFAGTCNAWRKTMPFLFGEIGDWKELLMPDDLLSENSILAKVRSAMTDDACNEGVEIIGWLYQFYIGEKKDEIFEGLKKNIKISAENIPAATQLFTPDWIVKYLVQNSLGRLWLSLHPDSHIRNVMEYYVPDDPSAERLKVPTDINTPEDIKLCDLCCGSAHMLVCAFDLLYLIYEDMGYEARTIPGLILAKNLYGIELDPRAAALSSFALTMKARSKNRRFFKEGVLPNICCLKNVSFASGELSEYCKEIGEDLFSIQLLNTMTQFEDAENLGSLIIPELQDTSSALRRIAETNVGDRLDLYGIHEKVKCLITEADYLTQKYHVVVTNPPYMGGKGMNQKLKAFAEEKYPDSKNDLFAMFIERCCALAVPNGYVSMVTMQSWMFLSSFEKLRQWLFDNMTMVNLCHMGNMVMRIAFGTSSVTWQKSIVPNYRAGCCYVDYSDCDENGVPYQFPPDNERNRKALPTTH